MNSESDASKHEGAKALQLSFSVRQTSCLSHKWACPNDSCLNSKTICFIGNQCDEVKKFSMVNLSPCVPLQSVAPHSRGPCIIVIRSFSFQVPSVESLISCVWLSISGVKSLGGQVGWHEGNSRLCPVDITLVITQRQMGQGWWGANIRSDSIRHTVWCNQAPHLGSVRSARSALEINEVVSGYIG